MKWSHSNGQPRIIPNSAVITEKEEEKKRHNWRNALKNGLCLLQEKSMKKIFLLLFSVFALVTFADETAELDRNWKELQSRGIDLLPVPKKIKFHSPVELKKVAISGDPGQPYFKTICEELTARFTELGSKVPVEVSSGKVPGAYNIVLSEEPLKSDHLQAYTLAPSDDGIVLQGKENNLYSAATLLHLIVKENGKTVIYPAEVADHPDFPVRKCEYRLNLFLGETLNKDPQEALERMKPLIRTMFRMKITLLNDRSCFCPTADKYHLYHRLPKPEYKYFYRGKQLETIRLICEYAKKYGIQCGIFDQYSILGRERDIFTGKKSKDSEDPDYLNMTKYYGGLYFSWARLDMHRKGAEAIRNCIEYTGIGSRFYHLPDTGGATDPEEWSRRDQLTRETFGDDRASADAALFKTYMEGLPERGVEFTAVVYPYHGYQLMKEGIRQAMGLPKTGETEKFIVKREKDLLDYCRRLNDQLPPGAAICVREDPREEIKAFYDAYPGRKMDLWWYPELPQRSIYLNMPQEIRCMRTAYFPERAAQTGIRMILQKPMCGVPCAAFAEYSWNTAFPGWEYLKRSPDITVYNSKNAAFSALRGAEGFFGVKAGKLIAPVFDHHLSFYLAVDPQASASKLRQDPDFLPLVERNHKLLLDAIPSMDRAAELKKEDFKAGSYGEFIELYLWTKAAKAYSIANLASLRIKKAVADGKNEECQKIHDAALKEIAQAEKEYKQAYAANRGKAVCYDLDFVRNWCLKYKWNYFSYFLMQLSVPDFGKVRKIVTQAYRDREIFASLNMPGWVKSFLDQQKQLYLPADGTALVEHWIKIDRNNQIQLCANPPELRIRRDSEGLIFSGRIFNPDLYKQKPRGKQKFDQWPKGDSFEILIRPKDSEIGSFFQFVVDPDGNLCTLLGKKDPDGKKDPGTEDEKIVKHEFAPLPLKTERKKDSWSFELTVPYSVLGAKPKKPWKMVFGYNLNGKDPYFSRQIANLKKQIPGGGKTALEENQHTVYFYRTPSLPDPFDPAIKLNALNVTCEERVHSSGTGTLVKFTPALSSFRPLRNVRFSFTIEKENGNTLMPEQVICEGKTVPLFYQSFSPFSCQLENHEEAFFIVLKVSADGYPEIVRKIPVGKAAITVSGPTAESRAFASLYRMDKPFPFDKGTLSFKIKPNFSGIDRRESGMEFLTFAGIVPLRKFFWPNSFTIYYVRRYGMINCGFSFPKKGTVRRVVAKLILKKDQWTELKCTWDTTGEDVKLAVYADGKLLSDEVKDWKKPISTRPQGVFAADFIHPYFGGMPDGSSAFDGAIADIRY